MGGLPSQGAGGGIGTGPINADVTDRAARLLGIIFGNLDKLQQRAVTKELLVQLSNAGIEIDPRNRNWDLDFATDQVDVSGSSVSVTSTPISKVNIHNTALPSADTDILGTDITPTNSPTTFRVMVSISKKGKFSAAITQGGVTLVSDFNGGSNIKADSLNIFDMLVDSGDSINFRFSVTGGTINELRVHEIGFAAT